MRCSTAFPSSRSPPPTATAACRCAVPTR
jgi:hypothetical protein